jgi:hypothetical protein
VSLSQTPARILRKLAADYGYAVIPAGGTKPIDWTAYIDSLPDTANVPDKIMAFYDVGGLVQGREMRGERQYRPGFVIRLRGDPNDEEAVRNRGNLIQDLLDNVKNTVVLIGSSSFTLHVVSSTIPLTPNGQEVGQKARWLYSINGLLTVSEG